MLQAFLLNRRTPFDTHRRPCLRSERGHRGHSRNCPLGQSRSGRWLWNRVDSEGVKRQEGMRGHRRRTERVACRGCPIAWNPGPRRLPRGSAQSKKSTSSILSSSETFSSISPIRFQCFALRRDTSDRVAPWWSRSRMLPTGWSGLTFFAVGSTTRSRVSWMRLICAGSLRRHFVSFSKMRVIVLTSGVSPVATGCRSMHGSGPSDGCANRIGTSLVKRMTRWFPRLFGCQHIMRASIQDAPNGPDRSR